MRNGQSSLSFQSSSEMPRQHAVATSRHRGDGCEKRRQLAIAPVIGPPETVSKRADDAAHQRHRGQNIRVAKAPTRRPTTRCAATSSHRSRRRDQGEGLLHLGRHRRQRQRRAPRERRRDGPAGKSKDPWTSVTPQVVRHDRQQDGDLGHHLAAPQAAPRRPLPSAETSPAAPAADARPGPPGRGSHRAAPSQQTVTGSIGAQVKALRAQRHRRTRRRQLDASRSAPA